MEEEGVETMEEGVVETTMQGTERATTGEEDEGDFGYAKETKTAETEQVSQSEVSKNCRASRKLNNKNIRPSFKVLYSSSRTK